VVLLLILGVVLLILGVVLLILGGAAAAHFT
jgi:hypothetical protein